MTRALEIFAGLRADLAAAELDELRTAVRAHCRELADAQERDELIAVDLADRIGAALDELLASAHVMTPAARADVVGAARYFVSTADAIPDRRACTGLDDDVEVMNHVARALGRPDLVISE